MATEFVFGRLARSSSDLPIRCDDFQTALVNLTSIAGLIHLCDIAGVFCGQYLAPDWNTRASIIFPLEVIADF